MNSESYCAPLTVELKVAIGTKRSGRLSQTIILQHDNARSHTDNKTIETIQDLKFEHLEHPTYSSDLAPSDFYAFGPLKCAIRGVHFSNDREVKKGKHS